MCLEHTMGLLHPKWQQKLVVKQYLPKITVVYDFPHIGRTEKPGIYVAGDWASHDE